MAKTIVYIPINYIFDFTSTPLDISKSAQNIAKQEGYIHLYRTYQLLFLQKVLHPSSL